MPVVYDMESVEGVAIGVASGPMDFAELKEHGAEMWRRVSGPRVRILWDMSNARFNLSTEEVRELAEFVKGEAPTVELRTAFVVSTNLEYGLVRMFQVFRETEGVQTHVFRKREEALRWLSLED